MKKEIPNLLTLGNLLSGCLALWQIAEGNPRNVLFLTAAGMLFDFLDGGVARALRVSSPLGKELDSLADLVSFGVVPGFLVFFSVPEAGSWAHVAWLLPLFSAYRLAQFNIDTKQTEHFLGLPTPANAAFWIALPWLPTAPPAYWTLLFTALMSVLLVVRVPLFSFKFKHFGWSGNEVRYLFLLAAGIGLAVWQVLALPPIVLSYILVSLALPPKTRKQ